MNSLEANIRDNSTKGQLNTIRNSGNVPAIIYGGKEQNQKVSISKKLLKILIEKENFLSNIIILNVNGKPQSNKDIPNSGEVSNIAGTRPIKALIKAVKTSDTIISLIFIGAIKRLVKFLLHISSKNNILKPILVLNKKS